MPANLRRLFRKPLSHLLLDALRVGGTRGFAAAVRALRGLRLLPAAFQPGKDTESILVIALTPHLGDAVMLLPLLDSLTQHSSIPVDLAIEQGAAAFFQGAPGLRTVYPLRLGSTPPVSTAATIRRIGAVLREYLRHMRGCRPAICLMPRWGDDLFRAFYLAVLTGAPRRIGFAAAVGAPRYRLAPYRDTLLTELVQGGSGLHEPDRMLLLAQTAQLLPASPGGGRQQASPAMVRLAASVPWQPLVDRLGLGTMRAYAVLAPGATQAHKLWPAEQWSSVIRWLTTQGLPVLLLSGAADRATAEQLHREHPTATRLVAGVTTLAESAAILQHSTLFLGNDSGPAHMAGALGVPTVVLFTASADADADDPFSPDRNRPMGPRVRVLRPTRSVAPCSGTCTAAEAHCIRAISPAAVIEAAAPWLHLPQNAQGAA